MVPRRIACEVTMTGFLFADNTGMILGIAGAVVVLLLVLWWMRRGATTTTDAERPEQKPTEALAAPPVEVSTSSSVSDAAKGAVATVGAATASAVAADERVAEAPEAVAKPPVEAADKPEVKAEVAKADAEVAKVDAEVAKVAPAEPAPRPEPTPKPEPVRTVRDGLGKTRKEGFIARLGSLFASKKTIDDSLIDEIEEVLFTADIGVKTADRLLNSVREAVDAKSLSDPKEVWKTLRSEARAILDGATDTRGTLPKEGEPKVIMVLGVNGTGKTTSIGKLAHRFVNEGHTVQLVAGDTFRAAAAEQLEHWGRRVGAKTVRGKEGADPASVVFDGVESAVVEKADIVLVDTAGRLHTQKNLMEELKKVRRVMGRAIDGAPHEVLMVLDATTGQNAIQQATMFNEATDVTGIILTKLDGTAKGGVVLGVCDALHIPIRYIGIGERVADLKDFDGAEFVEALFAS